MMARGRGLADVVGVGLEGQAPQGQGPAGHARPRGREMALDLLGQHQLLAGCSHWSTASMRLASYPASRAVPRKAFTSLGKQEPP